MNHYLVLSWSLFVSLLSSLGPNKICLRKCSLCCSNFLATWEDKKLPHKYSSLQEKCNIKFFNNMNNCCLVKRKFAFSTYFRIFLRFFLNISGRETQNSSIFCFKPLVSLPIKLYPSKHNNVSFSGLNTTS